MALDWDAWIGQDDPEEEVVLSTPTPPPVLDDLQEQAIEIELNLEKRIEEFTKDSITLPEPKSLLDYPDEIVQDPVLIEGLLRRGRKGMITADSKAGKSFFSVELAICVAAGIPFLGRKCEKAKVCYFNYEIEEKEFMQRVKDVAKALKVNQEDYVRNLKVVHMRGMSMPLSKMVGAIIAMMLNEYKLTRESYSLIILDPIYKVTAGDENSAKDVGQFCNQLDKIAKETGCALFYTHHHSKGDQGGKKAMDRGSGSGVFARDSDLMIDLTALEIDGQTKAALINNSMCEFFRTKLDETGTDWKKKYAPYDIKSSGAMASLYQTVTGTEPSKMSIMIMNEQDRIERELTKTKAFRMEFVVRSFENPEIQNVTFSYPIHLLDKSGALVMAEPESYMNAAKKKDTAQVKEGKMDIFVETVDQLIMASPEGYTTYSAVSEALDVDPKTVTNRLKACDGRYEIEKANGRGNVAKIRLVYDS